MKFQRERMQRNIEMEHPRWPDNTKYWQEELEDVEDSEDPLKAYFSDSWNVLDWLVYLLLIIVFALHIIDFTMDRDTRAATCGETAANLTCMDIQMKSAAYLDFVATPNTGECVSAWYNRIFAISIIFLWFRMFKFLQAFRTLGPFIVIIG